MSYETIDYYNQHAAEYMQATVNVDMASLYAEFLPLVKPGGHILDAGCGSGRDTSHFKQQGFSVSAFDASTEMARLASTRLQQTVAVRTFEQFDEAEAFDGIWCCASLLHVANKTLPDVFTRLQRALKPRAVLYVSFKYGDSEREANSRHFTDMNEQKLTALIKDIAGLTLKKNWLTCDQRPERNNENWLNALLIKDAE